MGLFLRKKHDGEQWPPDWLIELLDPGLRDLESEVGVKLLRKGRQVAPPFKCGSYGCVFFLEGDATKILKITEDADEGPYSAYVRMLQQADVATKYGSVRAVTVRVDGVWRLSEDGEPPVYAILEERVNPGSCKISDELAKGSDRYTDGWDAIMRLRDMKKPSEKTVIDLTERSKRYIKKGMFLLDSAGPSGKAIAEFLRMVQEDGQPLTDMHHSNLCVRKFDGPEGSGQKKGQIVIIDFGVSTANSPFRRMIKRLP